MTNQAQVPEGPTKEIRFAVVMYGGVSLAIYMNGIAQELLRLVRSTRSSSAPAAGTERVYRKLSYMTDYTEDGSPNTVERAQRQLESNAAPATRFVVDVISGTSAGGINGIFLAKALANGEDMESLKRLWIDEGDFGLLLNDKGSADGLIRPQTPPASLLNSQRMYAKLLGAMDEMNTPNPSPLQDEVDLFVTNTDLIGLVVPIRLADKIVFERRHRGVLHFRFSKRSKANDFEAENNPFLAFAARATSSFPFAFEPMMLSDIDPILDTFERYANNPVYRSDSKEWERFYGDYKRAQSRGILANSVPFPKRPLADGGDLDNKPFTHAIRALRHRTADVPVERKLIYVEPSPEHVEQVPDNGGRPNAVINASKALTLPAYETIREDLQNLQDQSRLRVRVMRIIRGIESDIERSLPRVKDRIRNTVEIPHDRWAEFDLKKTLQVYGTSFLPYHRLEIASVSDDITRTLSRLLSIDDNSDYCAAIRLLIAAWREERYVEYRETSDAAQSSKDERPTLNRFLYDFNIAFVLRRLRFLRSKIDDLYRLDTHALASIGRLNRDGEFWAPTPLDRKLFRDELLLQKQQLNLIYSDVLDSARSAVSTAKNPAYEIVYKDNQYLLSDEDLKYILGGAANATQGSPRSNTTRFEEECIQRAKALLQGKARNDSTKTLFDALDDATKIWKEGAGEFKGTNAVRSETDSRCRALWVPDGDTDPVRFARGCLTHYYAYFPYYDMAAFQILYGTPALESQVIDVTRISPFDADMLIDEAGSNCSKLAGVKLAHFGALLKRSWRESDILWGRLDGAERIVKAILPEGPKDVVEHFVGELHAEIILESLRGLGPNEKHQLLSECARWTMNRQSNPEILRCFVNNLIRHAPHRRSELEAAINVGELCDYYNRTFKTESTLDRKDAAGFISRSVAVVGRMLDAISAEYDIRTPVPAALSRAGRMSWWLVEASVPGLPNLFFRHWLALFLVFEVILLVLGIITGNDSVVSFAGRSLGLTATVGVAGAFLGAWILRAAWLKQFFIVVTAVLSTMLLLLAGHELFFHLPAHFVWLRSVVHLQDIVLLLTAYMLACAISSQMVQWVVNRGIPKGDRATRRNLEFELAASGDTIRKILTVGSMYEARNRRAMQFITRLDYFLIPGYWGYLTSLAAMQAATGAFYRWLFILSLVLITIAALFDCIENKAMLVACRAILQNKNDNERRAESIRRAATTKWTFFFATSLVVPLSIWAGNLPFLHAASIGAGLLAFAGISGLFGLASRRQMWIKFGLLLFAVAAIAIAVGMWRGVL
jgi:patatin-related protein